MKTFDPSVYFVTYNLVIGMLLMVASEKFGVFASRVGGAKTARLTHVGVRAFGATVAITMFAVLIFGHWLQV